MSEEKKPAPAAAGRGAAKKELSEHFKTYKDVWVFIEMERGKVHTVSWELLGEGRKLADKLGVQLAAVILGPPGNDLKQAISDAWSYGADLAYVVSEPLLKDYRNEPYSKALTDLVNTHKPEILLLGASTLGRDLAGSVATTLKTGLTADCTELAIDDDRCLAATRPTFGGTLLCTIFTLNFRPQMATIRPRVMAMPERRDAKPGRVIEFKLSMVEDDIVTKILDFVPDTSTEEAHLAYADIVVAGGLGMGNPGNFRLITDLAAVLGAEYGGSRPTIQKGWISADRQIGQTGKTIRPKLYIAAGISGAIQHRVGVEGADMILAINTDANAPIFEFAHYGLVGDATRILPALTKAFEARLAVRRMAS
ncbi:electron transfer flavoprotein subunit alpha/FixB family protein [Rhodospirillum rubrum]|uniref:Electron transfer flavoprotein n=2 Tax=Rhodospirillum rubrum TaxID=1085 RepID=Q2RS29_RHORT|nr:electron transfer flavoprotein subunit alpha/FixB family protein [Rhodospirillum rubrum]AAQ62577.1 FixB [Rhodospirillum rubrum]ABC23066.1 Electron transfer flavoprotein [Rhodospirillum rubrum ATCC 11170]AEO48795.1 electron transfer flavoprotein [Rhodospirillum rubrum F11]MBK5954693.1 electron transfer flavoprotein subunit alpha/FixB family protein [Rhodospirillum rubrum]QXG79049.1 electron transfer flavoprotein subunit alpha/FixB family protein [Rhodospirillum rubrum]